MCRNLRFPKSCAPNSCSSKMCCKMRWTISRPPLAFPGARAWSEPEYQAVGQIREARLVQRALGVDLAVLLLPQRCQFLKLPLEVLRRAGEDKTKRYTAIFAIDGVVQPVRLVEASQISLLGIEADIDAVMNKHVVGEEVDGTVGRNAEGDNQRPGGAAELNAPFKQGHRNYDEEYAESVVQLPDAFTRLVMTLVQDPERSMHNILMQKPGHAFHCEKYGKKYSRVQEPIAH